MEEKDTTLEEARAFFEIFKFMGDKHGRYEMLTGLLDILKNEKCFSPEQSQYLLDYCLTSLQKADDNRFNRKSVLRGLFLGQNTEFLAFTTEMPISEVENLSKGYDVVYRFWSTKRSLKKAIIEAIHLSESEVRYLMNLFSEKLN